MYVCKCNVITHNNNTHVDRYHNQIWKNWEKCLCQWMILKIRLRVNFIGKNEAKTKIASSSSLLACLQLGIFL